ncbi:unnamed protein product [Orchesella dallaii]|uniref:Uncharacterized protein n=1 Tax=Orchesella dallaii TaxID=48710 RepID=A0ABP1S1A6_9HEXA
MATSTGCRVFLLVALIVILSAVGTSGIHCYHCVQVRKFISNGSEIQIHDSEQPPSSFIRSHPSCAYGEEPDSSLSLECSTEQLAVAMFRENYSNPDTYAELEYKIDKLANETHGKRFACMAIVSTEPAKQISDDMTTQVQFTMRTCFPDHLNFTKELEILSSIGLGSANVSGYTCDLFDNCNGKGGAESHRACQSPAETSAGRKVTYMFYPLLAACISLLVKLLY